MAIDVLQLLVVIVESLNECHPNFMQSRRLVPGVIGTKSGPPHVTFWNFFVRENILILNLEVHKTCLPDL